MTLMITLRKARFFLLLFRLGSMPPLRSAMKPAIFIVLCKMGRATAAAVDRDGNQAVIILYTFATYALMMQMITARRARAHFIFIVVVQVGLSVITSRNVVTVRQKTSYRFIVLGRDVHWLGILGRLRQTITH